MRILVTCAVVLLASLATPRDASARGVIVYHNGQDFFETGPVPAEFASESQLENAKAGYGCDIFGVFWAYFTIKNCKPAIEKVGGTVFFVDAELASAIKAKYPQSSMKIGLWTQHGRWVLLAALLGAVAIMLLKRAKQDDEDEDEAKEAKEAKVA